MKLLVLFSILILYLVQISVGQEWSDFKRRHVINPDNETSFRGFGRFEWNNWAKEHDEYYRETNKIHVFIGDDKIIMELFDEHSFPWHYNTSSGAVPGHYWSLKPTSMYVMTLNHETNDYDTFDCADQFYFVAKVDMLRRPVRPIGYSDKPQSTFIDDTNRCSRVKDKSSSNSIESFSILSLTLFAILLSYISKE